MLHHHSLLEIQTAGRYTTRYLLPAQSLYFSFTFYRNPVSTFIVKSPSNHPGFNFMDSLVLPTSLSG
jgi:hypothetical protein